MVVVTNVKVIDAVRVVGPRGERSLPVTLVGGTAGMLYTVGVTTGGRLKVDVTGAGGATQYQDGTVLAAGQVGNVVLGTDGANLQFVSVDAAGHVQVDVLSGGGGSQYQDAHAVVGGELGNVMMGADGANLRFVHVDAAGDLQVDVLSMCSLPGGANLIGSVVVQTDDGVGAYQDWPVDGGQIPRVRHSDGTWDMPVGDALARRIYTNVCDASLEAAVKADGGVKGNALLVIPGQYEVDPAVAAADSLYFHRLAKHRFQVQESPGGHYLEEGRAFGAANSAYIACDVAAGPGTHYPFLLKAEGARNARVKHLAISVSALSAEPVDVWLYLQPTITLNGNAINETNRSGGNATANTVQAYDTPTIGADGGLWDFRHIPIGGSWELLEEDLVELPAGQGNLLVKAISSDTQAMGFLADVAVGCLWWEEA